ncbi:hypothetical protein FRX31_033597 [Thalictrum thalictroides]|uniref:Uncharacterized protein n=1 Tax=Thalictrum thalictroides TaxID=46969 RepID=A0A7J6UW38_THATH|nr:hypothetical protein FRX31_033597 [Thalictrum thalictroides]
MANSRFPTQLPRRVLARSEGKSFQIDWIRQAKRGEDIELVERSSTGVFSAKISLDGGRWLGKLFCQISLGTTTVGTVFRKIEEDGSITGVLEANKRENFLRLVVFRRHDSRKFRSLCFPAGSDFESWGFLGTELRKILEDDRRDCGLLKPPALFHPLHQPGPPMYSSSYAEVVEGGGGKSMVKGDGPNLVLAPSKLSLHANWWSPVAICRSDSSRPNWLWVESKVKGIFNHATFKYPNKVEALIVLGSEDEVNYLASLPRLTSWEGSFSFSSWSPAAGSISKSEFREMGKNLKICFKGIPYHLRSRSTVDSLAKACGDSWIVEEESINHTGDNARVIMKAVNLEKIPRVLYLT